MWRTDWEISAVGSHFVKFVTKSPPKKAGGTRADPPAKRQNRHSYTAGSLRRREGPLERGNQAGPTRFQKLPMFIETPAPKGPV
jgi:hypothetical protein